MLGRKVAGAAALVGSLQLFAKLLDLVSLIILARILTPADFGLVAIAVSVLVVATSVTELPVFDVLVQRSEVSPEDLDTAFTLTALRGLLVATAIVAASWPIAVFFEDSRLVLLLCFVSLSPLLQGLSSPGMVNFLRRVDFGPTARAAVIGKFGGFGASIAIAWWTGSYWAIVAGLVATSALTTLCTHLMAPSRLRFRLEGAGMILEFAGWVTLSRIIWTISIQADKLLVGRVLGRTQLGHYSMASDIASLATYAIAGPIMQPVFSGFSRIKDDVARLRHAYIKSQQILMMVVLPFGVGLAVVAEHMIPLMLGDGWSPSIPVIEWLAPVIALQMMSVPVQAVSMALGQPKALVLREGLGLILRLPATLLAAVYFGWRVRPLPAR